MSPPSGSLASLHAGGLAAALVLLAGDPHQKDPRTMRVEVPGTTLEVELVSLALQDSAPLWMSRTEVTWDLYDAFTYELDGVQEAAARAGLDAISRPSKPYIAMDRGFGHAGYPAIGISHHGAKTFCRWLGAKTERSFRLPREEELLLAARSTLSSDAGSGLQGRAWCRENSGRQTHPVATRQADELGLFDLLGNAAEWCLGEDGRPLVFGGSYLDPAEALLRLERVPDDPAWNSSDPQIPKSEWWLADATFVGFRVVCEPRPEPRPENGPSPPQQD